ncbi:D-glucuronyl C5-epimerase family protein [Paenibacillus campinasensis]|uniref:D-glucuronyl C5-epimerase family protein n=1 Tax=Paenibacillus campinasensis TaxID=66347 RepID=UPI0039B6EDB6
MRLTDSYWILNTFIFSTYLLYPLKIYIVLNRAKKMLHHALLTFLHEIRQLLIA